MTTPTVNTNTTSLVALYNFNQSTASLATSVERLSSGLRINRSADDAASLSIATKLNNQALSMGQAIRNANDGISIMQIADSSLEESINILGSVKTKAIQAAQDSQTTSSRRTIQQDIDKLLQELDTIAQTAKYNDHPLLTGAFANKRFQVGATSGEDIMATISSAESTQIGHITQAELTISNDTGGAIHLTFDNNQSGESLTLQSVNVEYANDTAKSMLAVSNNINQYTDQTGISSRAVVESTSSKAVTAGATSSTFAINDVTIGAVTTLANDSNSALANAINTKQSSTGVTASITSAGLLKLTSDGRPIEVSGVGSALDAADASSMSTFGLIHIYQQGAYQLDMTDLSTGLAVSFTSNLDYSGTMTTTIDSTLASSSVLGAASTLAAGFTTGATFTGALLNGNITTTADSTLQTATVLAPNSVLAKDSVMGGDAVNNANLTTTGATLMAANSTLLSGSTLAAGTYLTNDITTASGTVAAGTTLNAATTTTANTTISNAMLLVSGSILASGSTFAKDSYVGADLTLTSAMTMAQDMTLKSGSTIVDTDGTTSLAAGSTIGGAATIAASDITLTRSMTVKSGSVLSATTSLATGSTIGGTVTLNGAHTTSADLSLAANSVLAAGSVIKTGTVLTNDLVTTVGTISSGTTTAQDYTTSGSNTVTNAMTVKSGSQLASGSQLTANAGGSASISLSSEEGLRLADLSVLTSDGAQTAIKLAEAALTDLTAIRADIGATQNQFGSSVANLSSGKINVESAVSTIMDADLAEESTIFARMQVLNQTGAFALTQANALQANILTLFNSSG